MTETWDHKVSNLQIQVQNLKSLPSDSFWWKRSFQFFEYVKEVQFSKQIENMTTIKLWFRKVLFNFTFFMIEFTKFWNMSQMKKFQHKKSSWILNIFDLQNPQIIKCLFFKFEVFFWMCKGHFSEEIESYIITFKVWHLFRKSWFWQSDFMILSSEKFFEPASLLKNFSCKNRVEFSYWHIDRDLRPWSI